MQNRFKSKILWLSLASAVIAFLVNAGVIDTGMSDTLTQGVNTLTTILVAVGILNVPTDPNKF